MTHSYSVFKAFRVGSTACLLGLICLIANTNAQIVLDYTHDNGFFSGNAQATAALEAAISDINSVLNLNLSAVRDTAAGSSGGGTTATFDFRYTYTNPTTGASETINDTTLAVNEIRIFVGSQTLGTNGSGDDILGQGGPGGNAFSAIGAIGSGSFQTAINDAIANDTHRRGGGPIISQLAGAFDSGETFSIDFGLSVGNLWFDDDTQWHFDHTTAVESGKRDFYSVALHETLHVLGIGGSNAWESLVMDPDIQAGVRKGLTLFDVAALRDLGFNTIIPDVPVPVLLGDVNLDEAVDFLDISPFILLLSTTGFLDEADINRDEEVIIRAERSSAAATLNVSDDSLKSGDISYTKKDSKLTNLCSNKPPRGSLIKQSPSTSTRQKLGRTGTRHALCAALCSRSQSSSGHRPRYVLATVPQSETGIARANATVAIHRLSQPRDRCDPQRIASKTNA